MLSLQEIKLMIEKLERIEKEDWNQFTQTYLTKLKELQYVVENTNKKSISDGNDEKPLEWFEKDLAIKEDIFKKNGLTLLDNEIKIKISQFSKSGNVFQNCLEIGSGFGRHINFLLPWRLIFISEKLFSCKKKIIKQFPIQQQRLMRFYHTNTYSCPDVPTKSVNFVFSWDTFVFFGLVHIDTYIKDIERVLIPGGYGFIHYCDCNYDEDLIEAKTGHWAYNTREKMESIISNYNMKIVETSQFKPKANYIIFQKPGNDNPVAYNTKELF